MYLRGLVLFILFILVFVSLKTIRSTDASTSELNAVIKNKSANNISTIRAAGRGKSYVNLTDSKSLVQRFAGEESLVKTLNEMAARPLSLTTADFDEDGTPDLVSGFAAADGGVLAFARGNVDAVYPNSPEAKKRKAEGTFTEMPFLAETKIFVAPETVNFLGAGDFDADGHWDLVSASRGSHSLFWFAGDGSGNFSEARRIELKGAATALTVGEINRPDGLDEVIVGIDGAEGAKVLVFEHPTGALSGEPEVFDMPASVSSLALGRFDDDFHFDLAVGSGTNLQLISGRDRKLSHLNAVRARVPNAETQTLTFPFEIEAIAVGNFVQQRDSQTEIALLSKNNDVHILSRREEAMMQRQRGEWREEKDVLKISQSDVSSNTSRLFITSRTASSPLDTLLINTGDNQIHILTGEKNAENTVATSPHLKVVASLESQSPPVAALPMRLNVDALSDLVILTEGETAPSIVLTELIMAGVVTNTNDSGRAAIHRDALG